MAVEDELVKILTRLSNKSRVEVKEGKIRNKWFEVCMRDPTHPYHNKQCDRNCPHWDLCMRGEFIHVRMYVIDADEERDGRG